MDDILRPQDDTNGFADRDVDIVIDLIIVSSLKFAIGAGVEDFPVELFAGDFNLKLCGASFSVLYIKLNISETLPTKPSSSIDVIISSNV